MDEKERIQKIIINIRNAIATNASSIDSARKSHSWMSQQGISGRESANRRLNFKLFEYMAKLEIIKNQDTQNDKLEKLKRENIILNNQLKAAQNVALTLREANRNVENKYDSKTTIQNISNKYLKELIEITRKKNKTINFTAIGKALGCDNETVQRHIKKRNLS